MLRARSNRLADLRPLVPALLRVLSHVGAGEVVRGDGPAGRLSGGLGVLCGTPVSVRGHLETGPVAAPATPLNQRLATLQAVFVFRCGVTCQDLFHPARTSGFDPFLRRLP